VNNLKQIALAMHNYVSANDALPPVSVDCSRDNNGNCISTYQRQSQHARHRGLPGSDRASERSWAGIGA
jgi:hypothetical protein